MSHLVDAPVSPGDPLIRVLVVRVGGRVVERRAHEEYSPRGEQGRHVVLVQEQRVPAVIPIELTDDFPPAVGIDRFQNLILPEQVHMPPDAVHHGGPVQLVDPLQGNDAVRGNEDIRVTVEPTATVPRSASWTEFTGVRGHAGLHLDVAHAVELRLIPHRVVPDGDL